MSRSRDRRIAHAACITAGSALRQFGRHADAEPYDRRALRLASSAAERANAWVGLAADAIGAADVRTAGARIERAASERPRDARARIRIDWVRAEHALLEGRPVDAASFADRAVTRARAAGFARHEAKSLLFLGAALDTAGRHRDAARALRRGRAIAGRIGAAGVVEVCEDLLGRIARR